MTNFIKEDIIARKVLLKELQFRESKFLAEAISPQQIKDVVRVVNEITSILEPFASGSSTNPFSRMLKDLVSLRYKTLTQTDDSKRELLFGKLIASSTRMFEFLARMHTTFPSLLALVDSALKKTVQMASGGGKSPAQQSVTDIVYGGNADDPNAFKAQLQSYLRSPEATVDELLANTSELAMFKKLVITSIKASNKYATTKQQHSTPSTFSRLKTFFKGLFSSNVSDGSSSDDDVGLSLVEILMNRPERLAEDISRMSLQEVAVLAFALRTFEMFLKKFPDELWNSVLNAMKTKAPSKLSSKVSGGLSNALDKVMGDPVSGGFVGR